MAARKRFRAWGEHVVIVAGTLLLLEVVYRLHPLFGLSFSVVLLSACILLLARKRRHD